MPAPSEINDVNNDKYLLQSVDNALYILDLISDKSELTISDICKITGQSKSTVFRILYTLMKNGYIKADNNGKYHLSYKMMIMSKKINERSEIIRSAHHLLSELSSLCNETTHLVVWNTDSDVVFIDKVTSSTASIRMDAQVGYTAPAHITSTGKVLLAFSSEDVLNNYLEHATFNKRTTNTISNKADFIRELNQIRDVGYGQNDEESEIGLTTYAAPIILNNIPVAAISIAGPTVRMHSNKETFIELVKEYAVKISKTL
ncbi:MAG: IclR family transcriptional regulator [Lachnospiraceae bacterium]